MKGTVTHGCHGGPTQMVGMGARKKNWTISQTWKKMMSVYSDSVTDGEQEEPEDESIGNDCTRLSAQERDSEQDKVNSPDAKARGEKCRKSRKSNSRTRNNSNRQQDQKKKLTNIDNRHSLLQHAPATDRVANLCKYRCPKCDQVFDSRQAACKHFRQTKHVAAKPSLVDQCLIDVVAHKCRICSKSVR